jgi:ATP-binding cassette subfamily B protein
MAFTVLLILIINGPGLFGFSVANVVLLYILTNQLLSQTWTLNGVLRDFNRAIGDAKEMVEILDEPLAVEDKSDKELMVKSAEIDFHNMTFQHAEQKTPLFVDFNLEIKPGERIGLVGVSGSGKTTLTKLLLRFADISAGVILIDGQDISMVTQNSLRSKIAYVPQETALFHRSIAENIAYGKPDSSIEKIRRAAKLANVHEFIEELPDEYETLVGERGVKLSGGQRQRIVIARAILKDAPILVLDEATSALDSESEELIQGALKELMKGRTSLVIAHRLSTVAALDRIVVLRAGKIVEEGTHRQLIRKGGEYDKLWSRQSGAFLEEDEEIS